MQLLLINPNSTEAMTNAMVKASQPFIADDVTIIGATSCYGPPSIEGYYDEVFSIPPMLEEINRHIQSEKNTIDGVIIGCFDDTGVDAARSMLNVPVIGLCQAAMQTASLLSNSFSIVTTLSRSVPALHHLVNKYGFSDSCRQIRASDIPVLELESPGSNAEVILSNQIEQALNEENIEAIVLGCAGMVNLTERLSEKFQIPVVEGVIPAINIMTGLVRSGYKTSKKGGYAYPVSKEYKGEYEKHSP